MVLIPVQILLGDMHGINTLEHQPAKLAAMEGIWKSGSGVPAVIFAVPNQATHSNDYEVSIPKLASLYLTHSWNGEVKGLDAFGDKIPPVAPVFFAFRIMVGVGVLMLLVSWFARWQLRGTRSLPQWTARALVLMTFSGWIAVLSGWYVTEIGRQPYLVTGVLTTAQAVTTLPSNMVLSTLLAYLAIYIALLLAYIWAVFYLARQADEKGAAHSSLVAADGVKTPLGV
jgi:cytochrome d ubiquinol oxidase subunit I